MHCMMPRSFRRFIASYSKPMKLTEEQRLELIGHIYRRVDAIMPKSERTATEIKRARQKAMKGLIQSFSDEFGVRAERLWKQNETLKFRGYSLYDLHEFIDCYNPPEKKRKEKANGCSEQQRKLPRRRNPRMVQPFKRAGCSSSKCKILQRFQRAE